MSTAQREVTEVDVLIVGSGAGALTAAVVAAKGGADVLVVEKSDLYGGTSATSGGAVWIPNSHLAKAAGAEDSPEDAFAYIRALTDKEIPDAKVWAFIHNSSAMLCWLEQNTAVKMHAVPAIDYHPDVKGGKAAWRTHESKPLHASELGESFETLRPQHQMAQLFGRISWTLAEAGQLVFRYSGWRTLLVKMMARYAADIPQRLKSKRDRRMTLGNALVGRLRLSLNATNAKLWCSTPLRELITENGAVVGAIVERKGKKITVRARKAVILAAGGFEHNVEMRRKHLGKSIDPKWSGSQSNNTGDAIAAGVRVGAATAQMDSAWWSPSLRFEGEPRARMMTFERALPGSLMINQAGRRYMNEAESYHVTGRRMLDLDEPQASTIPSYIVFDSSYRKRYAMGALMPGIPDWLHSRRVRAHLAKANTWEDLARQINVPASALSQTIARFNTYARRGFDEDFGRGSNAYDRAYGDPHVSPNPNLSPLETAPFYAMPVFPGDIGTNGGLATNEHAQVLNTEGLPIPGLYAIGNTSASVMGHSYPGAGGTIGPSMTFAFVAARHILTLEGEGLISR